MRKFIPIIKNKMNTIDLKNKISTYYHQSIKVINGEYDNHPVRVLQAIKSIIGINPREPLQGLLKFYSTYLDQYNKSKIRYNFKDESIPEVITFADLELSLISKDLEHSKKNIYYLTNVSDGMHILEFLLEFCIKYNLKSLFIVWSIYKMMLFLKGKYIMESLIFCINSIVNEKSTYIKKKYNKGKIDSQCYLYDKKTFPLFLTYYSILKEDLVRKENISKYIYHNMHSMLKFSKNKLSKLKVHDSQFLEGRLWLNNHIKSLSDKHLNSELIIILELSRGALKVSQENDAKIIWHNLNIYLEKE